MKVVIDSNIFVMCLNPLSKYNDVFGQLIKGAYQLCITTDISLEYLEVFQLKFQKAKADNVYKFLLESSHVLTYTVYYTWQMITEDPDDNKFVDCAITANADYVVTNDKHFNILKQIDFPQVNCITIDEFMEVLKKQ